MRHVEFGFPLVSCLFVASTLIWTSVAFGTAGNMLCCQDEWEPATNTDGVVGGVKVCKECSGFGVNKCVGAPTDDFHCEQGTKAFRGQNKTPNDFSVRSSRTLNLGVLLGALSQICFMYSGHGNCGDPNQLTDFITANYIIPDCNDPPCD